MTRKAFVIIAFAFLALLTGCEEGPKRAKNNGIAPDFELTDMKGVTHKLSQYRGKYVILEFWATWCPPCKLAVPELNEVFLNTQGTNVVLLSISVDERKYTIEKFMKEYEVLYPILFDDKKVGDEFGVYSIPTTIIVGPDGKVFKKHVGYAPGELVRQARELLQIK